MQLTTLQGYTENLVVMQPPQQVRTDMALSLKGVIDLLTLRFNAVAVPPQRCR